LPQLSRVVHDEIELVIQGIREKVKAVRSGVLIVVTGAVIIFAAFNVSLARHCSSNSLLNGPVIAALVTGRRLL